MCGIAGIVPRSNSGLLYTEDLKAMLTELEHRGPDATYHFINPNVALGMTRLAIVGGDNGVQPIWNETHTCAVVCNGEIYNYHALKETLTFHGHEFQTDSDVEVIIHLYEEYGEQFLSHLEGIFALSIWDAERQRMLIARDRIGVKPLYYINTDDAFAFASELRALLPFAPGQLNVSALASYHELRFAPAPYTLVERIEKLPPAHYAVIHGRQLRVQGYWKPTLMTSIDVDSSVKPARQASDSSPTAPVVSHLTTDVEKQQHVRGLIEDAVNAQRADGVKSSVLLSGGLDSTLLVALQTKLFGTAPNTITVSFKPPASANQYVSTEYDEHSYARQVADLFGCEHRAEEFDANETWDLLPQIVSDLDEPIADPTALPLWFASRLAHRSGHRVMFSGEGMDELFAGYSLYRQTYWLRALNAFPKNFRQGLYEFLKDARWPGTNLVEHSIKPVTEWYRSIGELFDTDEINRLFAQELRDAAKTAPRHWSASTITRFLHLSDHARTNIDPLQQMLLFDCVHWLPENTLTKSDKISMAHSVELRVPFLNERLFEYALSLPAKDKMRRGVHKFIIRKAFQDVIPYDVLHRPKAGFPVPITAWVYGEWHDQIRDLLLSPDAVTKDMYQRQMVESLLSSSPDAQRRSARLLWSLVTMELWLKSVVERDLYVRGVSTEESSVEIV